MKVKKTEVGILTGLAIMLFILMPMLNPFITFSLGLAIIIVFLVIHFARLKKNYPDKIETKQSEQSGPQ
jgi:predicted membrane protein